MQYYKRFVNRYGTLEKKHQKELFNNNKIKMRLLLFVTVVVHCIWYGIQRAHSHLSCSPLFIVHHLAFESAQFAPRIIIILRVLFAVYAYINMTQIQFEILLLIIWCLLCPFEATLMTYMFGMRMSKTTKSWHYNS